jgi:hypothetical protein
VKPNTTSTTGVAWQDQVEIYSPKIILTIHYSPRSSVDTHHTILITHYSPYATPHTLLLIQVEVSLAEQLISLTGTQQEPVVGVSFTGVTFKNSRVTFLGATSSPRYQASGSGDWALYPSAAIYLHGTENIVIQDCMLTNIGGKGALL